MSTKFILLCLAIGIQYLLLHSHKAGQAYWAWIAPVSILLFTAGCLLMERSPRRGLYLAVFMVSSILVPPVLYAFGEWFKSPDGLSNVLVHDLLFYLVSTVGVSGGWLFAALLVWIFQRSTPPTRIFCTGKPTVER